MGSIIKAYCSCGYEKSMFLGGGMESFNTYCCFPVYCEECRILFEDNLFGNQLQCPKCKGFKTTSYDKKCSLKGDTVFEWNVRDMSLILTDGNYVCPRCSKPALTFIDDGCWD
jgi:hypothetical protein